MTHRPPAKLLPVSLGHVRPHLSTDRTHLLHRLRVQELVHCFPRLVLGGDFGVGLEEKGILLQPYVEGAPGIQEEAEAVVGRGLGWYRI